MTALAGRRVLVTGGAAGIGLALARCFAREGCALVLVDRDGGALERAAAELGAAAFVHDVAAPESAAGLCERVLREAGPVDVLVNNAGTVARGPFLDVPIEAHVRVYRVNVLGLVALTHAFLPHLIGRPQAHVVLMASASSFAPLPFAATYASSKWAVLGFAESLRAELRELGHGHVRVTAVCPSYVATELFADARPPLLTRRLDPGRLAQLVVRGVERDRRWVAAPALVRLLPVLRGVLPGPAFDAVARLFGVQRSLAAWRKGGESAR